MAGLVPAIHENSCGPCHPTSHSDYAGGVDLHDDQSAERDPVAGRHRRPYSARMATSRGIGRGLHQAVRADAAGLCGASPRYRFRDPARNDDEALAAHLKVRLILRDNPEWADL